MVCCFSLYADAPVSITFPGKKSLYKVGENVTVYSDAQPPATYVWYRLEGDGPETHSGETLTVTEAMRGNGGNNEYNVSADNLLNSPIYEAISINVEGISFKVNPTYCQNSILSVN